MYHGFYVKMTLHTILIHDYTCQLFTDKSVLHAANYTREECNDQSNYHFRLALYDNTYHVCSVGLGAR